MTNIVPFEGGRPPSVFAQRQSTLNQAAQQGVQASFAVIGYKGRNWRIKYRGEEELLKGSNGAPLPNLDVVIVGVSPHIAKQYYEKRYTEGSDEAPDCFSIDGQAPDPSSPNKQCASCAVCPKNIWGSRITDDGKKSKACQDSRRIAVVPLHDLQNETFGGPMMLRLPPMSLGNFANYASLLERKGASMEFVATRLGFDYDVAYPRITFEAIGWLSEDQAIEVVGSDGQGGICANPLIERMIREAVGEATHDPASAGVAQDDPLIHGAPPQVMAQRQAVVEVTAAPAPAPAQATQRKRVLSPSAFGGEPAPARTPAPTLAPIPAPIQVEQVAPAAPPTQVEPAPDDMNAAIDELLKMSI